MVTQRFNNVATLSYTAHNFFFQKTELMLDLPTEALKKFSYIYMRISLLETSVQ